MKIEVNTNDFNEALNSVGKVISKTSALELNNILINVNNKELTLVSTNMEQSVKCLLNLSSGDEGSVECCVQFNLIKDIVSLLKKNKPLNIEITDRNIVVSQDESSYTLSISKSDTFPVVPDLDSMSASSFSLSFENLTRLIENSSFAASQKKESKKEFQCVLIHITNGEVRFVASDSTVLAIEKVNLQLPDVKLLVPTSVLNMLTTFNLDPKEEITIQYVPSLVGFMFKNTKILSVIINGEFPDYTMLVREQSDYSIEVSKQALLSALKRLDVLAKTAMKRVKTTFEGGSLILETIAGLGKGQEKLMLANSVGDRIDLAFDIGRLMDGVSHAEGDIVIFGVKKSESSNNYFLPVSITSKKDTNYYYVIMPQRWVE